MWTLNIEKERAWHYFFHMNVNSWFLLWCWWWGNAGYVIFVPKIIVTLGTAMCINIQVMRHWGSSEKDWPWMWNFICLPDRNFSIFMKLRKCEEKSVLRFCALYFATTLQTRTRLCIHFCHKRMMYFVFLPYMRNIDSVF